jgi:hypothetical protein
LAEIDFGASLPQGEAGKMLEKTESQSKANLLNGETGADYFVRY